VLVCCLVIDDVADVANYFFQLTTPIFKKLREKMLSLRLLMLVVSTARFNGMTRITRKSEQKRIGRDL
jgi:hypothetical protein